PHTDALGRPQYYDKITHELLDHQGLPKQDLTTIPKGPDHPLTDIPKHDPVPATVGAHTADATAHTTPGGAADHTPGGAADHTPGGAADHTPHNSHTEPGTGPAGDHHTADTAHTAHGDGPGDGPGGGDHTPGAGDHGGSGGSGGEPPTGGHPGDPFPHEEPRPFERGSATEREIRATLRPGKPKPADLEKALNNLAGHPAGREVADLIASGRFKGMENFEQVLGSFSQGDKMAGGIEQLRLADRLVENGVKDVSFEIKGGVEIKPGVITGAATDMDVMARAADGRIFGYQFKEVANPKKVIDKMWANIDQLENCGADVKVFVVDTKGSVADMVASGIDKKLAKIYAVKDVLVVLRVEDGTLMYPPGATFMPGGRP
ncbi:hypothetical protein ACFV3D_32625, partial [Streptomyces sp. NPDC059708]